MQSSTRNESQAAPKLRSQFVTALAWFSIVVSALMVVSSTMQNVMVNFVLPPNIFDSLIRDSAEQIPSSMLFILKNVKAILFVFLLLSVVLLLSSIGLLQRKNWARITFIVLLALGVVSTIAALPMQYGMLDDVGKTLSGNEAIAEVESVMTAMRGVFLALVVLFTGIHVWLIYKLCTAQIRSEFA
jgi:hypothetical protein